MSRSHLIHPALLIASLVVTSTSLAQDGAVSAAELDWVPRSELPEDLLASCPRGCTGGYLQPGRTDPANQIDPALAEVNAEADSYQLDGEGGTARLQGEVRFTQGWRQVAADEIDIDRATLLFEMQGHITLREPDLLLIGESARIQADTNELVLEQASYLMHDLRIQGSADQVRRLPDGRIFIDNAIYSTCEPVDQDWYFVAGQIEIDPEAARILASDMRIKAGPVTIFYSPRFSFPLGDQRKTGLLYPIIESSGDNGIDYAQPIYLNLAPNYDLSLTPRFIERRGTMLESQFRWLHGAGSGSIDGAYLPNDRGGQSTITRTKDRWFGQLQVAQLAWGGDIQLDYSVASDSRYFADLGNASLESSSQTWLERRFAFDKQGANLDLRLTALSYQDLTDKELRGFRELPRLQLTGQWQAAQNWYLESDLEWVDFSPVHEDTQPTSLLQSDLNGQWIQGSRSSLDTRLGWRFRNAGSFVDLGLIGALRQYQLDNALLSGAGDHPQLQASGLLVDAGLIFERRSNRGQQTLELRLQFLSMHSDDQDQLPLFDTLTPRFSYQTLYRPNPFQGGDRIGDGERLSLGIESGWRSAASGRETLRLGLAQQLYLSERSVHLSPRLSAGLVDPSLFAADDPLRLAAQRGAEELRDLMASRSGIQAYLQLAPSDQWYGRALLDWSDQGNQADYGSFELGYRSTRALTNLAYHYERRSPVFRDANQDNRVQGGEVIEGNVEQLDLSAVLELDENWTLLGRWQQDLTHARPLEVLAGARYDACCWSASLVWRHWLERDDNLLVPEQALEHDNGIFVSFELKGLAGVGERLNNMLSGSIPGY